MDEPPPILYLEGVDPLRLVSHEIARLERLGLLVQAGPKFGGPPLIEECVGVDLPGNRDETTVVSGWLPTWDKSCGHTLQFEIFTTDGLDLCGYYFYLIAPPARAQTPFAGTPYTFCEAVEKIRCGYLQQHILRAWALHHENRTNFF